jgi:hypothetical protein
MPIEFDDQSLRVIGNNVKAIRFYDDARVLRAEVYLDSNNRLNIGDLSISTETTGGGGASVDISTVPLLTLSASTLLSNERVFSPGSGLTASDGGAGGTYTLNVGAGDGISVAADAVAVNSTVARSTWAVTAGSGLTGGGNLAAAGITFHVGAGDGISVAADAVAVDGTVARNTWSVGAGDGLTGGGPLSSGGITLTVGAGTGVSVAADSVGVDTTYAFTWTGGHTFAATTTMRTILPQATDTYDLGSSTLLWRKGYLSELDAVLLAQNTATAVGGWLIVSKNEGALPANVASGDTTIDFGIAMTVGDFVMFRALGQVEYVQVGSLVSGTTYNVTRNLDGSGANNWPAGAVFIVLGTTGNGRLELNAYDTPRMSIIRQGATYNAQTEHVRLGDLNGWGDYGAETYGLALGEYAASKANLTWDATNGLRLRLHNTTYIQLDTSGNALIAGKLQMNGASSAIAIGTTPPTSASAGTGVWLDRTGLFGLSSGTYQVKVDATDGKLYAGGGKVIVGATGITLDASATFTHILFDTSGSFDMYMGYNVDYGNVTLGDSSGRVGLGVSYYGADQAITTVAHEFTVKKYLNVSAGGGNTSYFFVGSGGVYTDRTMYFGSGSSAGDTNLYRHAANVLRTDDALVVSTGLAVGSYTSPSTGDIRASGGLYVGRDADPGDGNVGYSGALVSYKNATEYTGYAFVPLTEPLTSTSWDGDSYSTTSKTLIDLSAVFGVPAGVKAVLVRTAINDSGSAANTCTLTLSPNNTAGSGLTTQCSALTNDTVVRDCLVVPCDANGDIYYQIVASGASTMDVFIAIWGYWI